MKEKVCGVYKIQSVIKPERFYIGSSIDTQARWKGHRYELKKGEHHSPKLQRHFNKYGVDDLVFIVLEKFDFTTKEDQMKREQYYIDTLHPWFNINKKAGSPGNFKMPEESKRRLSEINTGKKASPEHIESLKRAWEKRKLIPVSQETRDKQSKALKGKPCWAKGLTKETDERLKAKAEAQEGRVVKPETREKISKTTIGKPHTDEHNKNSRDAILKRVAEVGVHGQTPETRVKISKIVTEYWARKKAGKESLQTV